MSDFMVMVPRSESEQKRRGKQIGAEELCQIDTEVSLRNHKKTDRLIMATSGYRTKYQPKAWQAKAWSSISPGLDLDNAVPVLIDRKDLNKRLRHLLRLGVVVKIKGKTPAEASSTAERIPVIAKFPSDNQRTYGQYIVGSNKQQFETILTGVYRMYITDRKQYVQRCMKAGWTECSYMIKAMLIYDDYSYDTVQADPFGLFELLGLSDDKFDKKGRLRI